MIDNNDYYIVETFDTASSKQSVKLPHGINVPKNFFSKCSPEDIPYLLEEEAARLFNEKHDKLNSALFTIASFWAGNTNGNFISELEDVYHGIVDAIKRIDSSTKLQSVLEQLQLY